MSEARQTIPLVILHGPLGSGKTTALRSLLAHPAFAQALIIENDMAEWNVDAETLAHDHHDVIPLTGGCICCGSVDEMKRILDRIIHSSRIQPVIIETTGVANVSKLLEWFLFNSEIYRHFTFRHVVMVVDVFENPRVLRETRHMDLILSDLVLCTKGDIASPEQRDQWLYGLDAVRSKVKMNSDSSWVHDVAQGTSSWLTRLPEQYEEAGDHGMLKARVIDWQTAQIAHVRSAVDNLFRDSVLGLERIKGYVQLHDHQWLHIEATREHCDIVYAAPASRSALICIGSNPDSDRINGIVHSSI